MNKKILNYKKIIALLAIVFCLSALLAGCGGDKISDISISESDAPRLTYVLGQELDLSQGSLVFNENGKERTFPLSDSNVSVSGYDKTKLGKQVLKVEYMGKETSFEVCVVERTVAQGCETVYFVGESFDTSKGYLRITNDDASLFTVNLSDSGVSIQGFDSASAGEKNVNISYKDGSSTVYEANISVKIYDVGQVGFTKPEKLNYESHETELSLSGGYLSVTASGYENISKKVSLSVAEISGFNPSLATAEHKTNPLKQTVSITYGGKSFNYEISVYYSVVYVIHDYADKLLGVDLSLNGINITEAEGELSINAIKGYFNLPSSEKAFVDEDKLTLIVSTATLYASKLYAVECDKFNNSFVVDGATGNLILLGKDYEKTKHDTEKLNNKEEPFNVYSELLHRIKQELSSIDMPSGTSVDDFIKIASKEDVDFSVGALNLLVSIYDAMKDIPSRLEGSELEIYGDNIKNAVEIITSSDVNIASLPHVYNIIGNWREENDFYRIIYSYYCYTAADGRDIIADTLWQTVPMPDLLGEWYSSLYSATLEAVLMAENKDDFLRLADTTDFMFFYFKTLKAAEQIKNGDVQLLTDIYEIINGDLIIENNIRRAPGGYVTHTGGMLASQSYLELWENYLSLIALYNESLLDFSLHGEKIQKLFDNFASLSPADLHGFLCSLNYLYGESDGKTLVLDSSSQVYSKFAQLLKDYYQAVLPESAMPMFNHLLMAIESYSVYCVYGNADFALASFNESIQKVKLIYESLNADDKNLFDGMLGIYYEQYLGIYEAHSSSDESSFGEYTDDVEELKSTLEAYFELLKFITDEKSDKEKKDSSFMLLFALYERASGLYEKITLSGDENIKVLLYSTEYDIGESKITLDSAFYISRSVAVSYLVSTVFETDEDTKIPLLLWDVYSDSELGIFLEHASCVLEHEFFGASLDKATVDFVTSSFRELGKLEQKMFLMMNCTLYYDGLEAFYHGQFSSDESAKKFTTLLLEAEYAYANFVQLPTSEDALEAFKSKMKDAIAVYGTVSSGDLRDEYLGEMYTYYTEIYYGLI